MLAGEVSKRSQNSGARVSSVNGSPSGSETTGGGEWGRAVLLGQIRQGLSSVSPASRLSGSVWSPETD